MKGRPVLFGEVLFDRFPDGGSVLGGAPFNVAWHLQAFALAPLLISRVGEDDPGREIRAAMSEWGMDTAGLQVDTRHPTGMVEVSITGGEPAFDILDARAYDYIQADALPDADAALIYHGTLALRNPAPARALRALRERSAVPVFLDVNLRPPWWRRETVSALLREANQVKLNRAELDLLESGGGDLYRRGGRLLERYELELLIITLGADGAVALVRGQEPVRVAPAAGAKIVDTVGAGDAFASIAIWGYIRGWPLALTLERAQRFASMVVGIRGATVRDPDFYRPILDTWGQA